jgi:thiol-disulfide isomerase/thioredoxin
MDKRYFFLVLTVVAVLIVGINLMLDSWINDDRYGMIEEPILQNITKAPRIVDAELFVTENCSPCEDELEFLESLKEDNRSWLNIEVYDVENESNFIRFSAYANNLGFRKTNVPVLVIDDDFSVAFRSSEEEKTNIRAMVDVAQKREIEELEANITFYLFWNTGCPHCAAEKAEFFPYIQTKYPDIILKDYNIADPESHPILEEITERLDFQPQSVPISVVGNEYYIGYGSLETTGKFLESMVDRAYESCGDENVSNATCTEPSGLVVAVPFIGSVNLEEFMFEMGIPMSTMVLGLLDGFNPCAFFVLTMLLSFMVYARSRKRMLVIGLTFVFVSGFVYFLFMTALFSVISALNEVRILALIGGVIALIIGVINLKDFFFFKKGVSLTISDDNKPKLYKRMRGLLKSQTLFELFVGTVLLAFIANSYELLCTAGIPLVYSNLLNAQQMGAMSYLYIALYNVFYVLPLLVIVLIFVKSLGGKKMEQETGEMLKSISGIMMVGFGILLITDPLVLSNILVTGSLIGFAAILGFTMSRVKKHFKAKETKEDNKIEETKEDNKIEETKEDNKIEETKEENVTKESEV